ncbi:MAG: TetR family transcriptional regulator [Alphaproteobacteria bacterium]|nr:TetR family transcriptional regulator [Alphaproteobacteria bacterium]
MADKLDRVIDAALGLAAEKGWRRLSLAAVARRAGLSLAGLYELTPSRAAILAAAMARGDRAMLAAAGELSGDPVRDRLFDLVMRRLDTLSPWRESVAAILSDLGRDPQAALCALPGFACSLDWMLRVAGAEAAGVAGMVRRHALAVVYLLTLRSWINDDSADQGKTLATLDRTLKQAESVLALTPAKGWGEAVTAEVAPPPACQARRRKSSIK